MMKCAPKISCFSLPALTPALLQMIRVAGHWFYAWYACTTETQGIWRRANALFAMDWCAALLLACYTYCCHTKHKARTAHGPLSYASSQLLPCCLQDAAIRSNDLQKNPDGKIVCIFDLRGKARLRHHALISFPSQKRTALKCYRLQPSRSHSLIVWKCCACNVHLQIWVWTASTLVCCELSSTYWGGTTQSGLASCGCTMPQASSGRYGKLFLPLLIR